MVDVLPVFGEIWLFTGRVTGTGSGVRGRRLAIWVTLEMLLVVTLLWAWREGVLLTTSPMWFLRRQFWVSWFRVLIPSRVVALGSRPQWVSVFLFPLRFRFPVSSLSLPFGFLPTVRPLWSPEVPPVVSKWTRKKFPSRVVLTSRPFTWQPQSPLGVPVIVSTPAIPNVKVSVARVGKVSLAELRPYVVKPLARPWLPWRRTQLGLTPSLKSTFLFVGPDKSV